MSAVPQYCCCGLVGVAVLWPAACMLPLLPHPHRCKADAASVRVTTGLVMPVCPTARSLANCWCSWLCARRTGTSGIHLISLPPKLPENTLLLLPLLFLLSKDFCSMGHIIHLLCGPEREKDMRWTGLSESSVPISCYYTPLIFISGNH